MHLTSQKCWMVSWNDPEYMESGAKVWLMSIIQACSTWTHVLDTILWETLVKECFEILQCWCKLRTWNESPIVISEYYRSFMVLEKFTNPTAVDLWQICEQADLHLQSTKHYCFGQWFQFISESSAKLMRIWNIVHPTSAPKNLRFNRLGERCIQTFKKLA